MHSCQSLMFKDALASFQKKKNKASAFSAKYIYIYIYIYATALKPMFHSHIKNTLIVRILELIECSKPTYKKIPSSNLISERLDSGKHPAFACPVFCA